MLRLAIVLLLSVFFIRANARKVTSISELVGNESAILEIDFSYKGLTNFPKEILKCKNLQKLNLSNNGLLKIPHEIGQLASLVSLDLSGNEGLNPTDLDEVFKRSTFNLIDLNLSGCSLLYLSESISNQRELEKLNVSGNRLTMLPYSMMAMNKLKDVNLSNNMFHDLSWIVNYWWSLKSIDVSGNKNLTIRELIKSLSYFDQLDNLIVSHVNELPRDFELLNTNNLVIKNSALENFPRSSQSNKINRITFDNCTFRYPLKVVNAINEFAHPNFVEFTNCTANNIIPFLQIKVDSVSLLGIGIIDIMPLSKVKELTWLDVRGMNLSKETVNRFQKERPNVELVWKEKLSPNIGVAPPIEKFIAQPKQELVYAGENSKVIFDNTLFEIPSDGIVDSKGKPYKGEVILSYQDYMNPADIFYSGITMTSNLGDETMMFSSGGMFSLNASDKNGNPLLVNPENPINVLMSSSSDNPDMELFQLDDSGVWQKVGKDSIRKPFSYDQSRLDSVMNKDFNALVRSQLMYYTDRYVPVVKKSRKNNSFELSFKEYKTYKMTKNETKRLSFVALYLVDFVGKYLSQVSLIYEGDSTKKDFMILDSISDYCVKQYKRLETNRIGFYESIGPDYISSLQLMPDFENDRFNLSFFFKDSMLVLPVNILHSNTNASSKIKKTQLFYKRYIRAWKQNKRGNFKCKMKLDQEIERKAKILKNIAVAEEKLRQEMMYESENYLLESAAQGSLVRSFQISGFGIWNCDARVRMKKPMLIKDQYITEKGEKVKFNSGKIVVIDHDNNGVIQFENSASGFYDGASKTTIVIFFSSILVGIHRTWQNKIATNTTEVKLINIENMNKSSFTELICADE